MTREGKNEWQRHRYRTDPVWAERQREASRSWLRRKSADPSWLEWHQQRKRDRMRKLNADPVRAEHRNATNRWRYANDPAYAERVKKHSREQRAKHRNDQTWQERRRIYQREYMRQRKTNPEFRAKINEQANKWRNNKWATDAVYREQRKKIHNNWMRRTLRINPDYYKRQWKNIKLKLQVDPLFAEKHRTNRLRCDRKNWANPEFRARVNKRLRERYRTDPELRASERARNRARRLKADAKHNQYSRKRSWILSRLLKMAHDGGILPLLKEQCCSKNDGHRSRERKINRRLILMARDDGMYSLLATEYDNGRRSL